MAQTNPQSFITKEGIEVKVDQVWRDLDKRMRGRCVQVRALGNMSFEGSVRIQTYTEQSGAAGPLRWLSVARMHHHSTGFELVGLAPDRRE